MLPAACAGVVAVTAMQQGNGTIDNTQNAAEWFSNFLNLDPNSPSPPTPNKANLTVSAPGKTPGDAAAQSLLSGMQPQHCSSCAARNQSC